VIPDNNAFKNHIFISSKNFFGAKNGDLVAVEIRNWKGKNPD
jgi:exoribonuclease R